MSSHKETIDKLDARVKQTEADVKKLKAEADDSDDTAFKAEIAELEKQAAIAQEKMIELRSSGEDAAEDVAKGAKNAWETLASALKRARSRFPAE